MHADEPVLTPGILADVARVVVPRRDIRRRVQQLADAIARCYDGEELTILAVLTGSLIFLADLIRFLPLRMQMDVVSVSSYPGPAVRSQGPRLLLPPAEDLAARHVLILDDILDSGRTLAFLTRTISAMAPASVRSCVLLRKRRPDVPDRPEADFFGFDIDDEFVVGYGLDYNNFYRNLPDLCVLRDSALGGCGAGAGEAQP